MSTCFVMQAFDGGPYDRRFEETFAPSIQRGGAAPVRADKILGTRPVIEKIEMALRGATIAFAEISEDNPNVFIELGYALDLAVPLVMVCDRAKRKALPFDISHRPVIFYKTESQGDFENLSREIQVAVAAALNEAADRARARQAPTVTLHNVAASDAIKTRILLEILEAEIGDPDGLSAYRVKSSLASEGFTERLASLAVLALLKEELIESRTISQYEGDPYIAFLLTDAGKDLLLGQYAEIKRQEEAIASKRTASTLANVRTVPNQKYDSDLDDDVPF